MKQIGDKYYLEDGDDVECDMITLTRVDKTYDDGKPDQGYILKSFESGEINYWHEEDEERYSVRYDFSLPKDDPMYGKPYFERE